MRLPTNPISAELRRARRDQQRHDEKERQRELATPAPRKPRHNRHVTIAEVERFHDHLRTGNPIDRDADLAGGGGSSHP